MYKTCNICNKTFPATTEYFHKSKTNKYGLRNYCKECTKSLNHDNYENRTKSKKYNQSQKQYIYNYRNTFKGNLSFKISCMKKSYKFHNIAKSRLSLTTNEFLDILKKFNYCCAYCGQSFNDLIPSPVIRISHGGNLNYNNTVCACASCVESKLSKTKIISLQQWYSQQPFYSDERLSKIIEHTQFTKK